MGGTTTLEVVNNVGLHFAALYVSDCTGDIRHFVGRSVEAEATCLAADTFSDQERVVGRNGSGFGKPVGLCV